MRTHLDVISDAGGATELGRRISVEPNTVHAWVRAKSIPSRYWRRLSKEKLATLDELAAAAEAKPRKSAA